MPNLCSYSLIIERGDAETKTFAKVKSFLDSNTKAILDPLYKDEQYIIQDYYLSLKQEDIIVIYGSSKWSPPQSEMYILLEALSEYMDCDLTQLDAYMTWTEFGCSGCGHIDFFFHKYNEVSSSETEFDTPQNIHELLQIVSECPPLKEDLESLIEDFNLTQEKINDIAKSYNITL